jgi:hypothetical protein
MIATSSTQKTASHVAAGLLSFLFGCSARQLTALFVAIARSLSHFCGTGMIAALFSSICGACARSQVLPKYGFQRLSSSRITVPPTGTSRGHWMAGLFGHPPFAVLSDFRTMTLALWCFFPQDDEAQPRAGAIHYTKKVALQGRSRLFS